MPTYSPALAHALAAIDEDTFIRCTDGTLVTQSSSQHIIADLINRLDVQPGMTVLEIGTGSGYSTALLAHLVGSNGHVVSVDVVAKLVDRAHTLLPIHGYANTTFLRADGFQAVPEHGPFDRIIAWATAPHLAAAWIDQISLRGVIVVPLALAPISKSGIGTRIRFSHDCTPCVDQIFPAGFVEMHGQKLDQWLVPPYGVDVVCSDDMGRPYWLSSGWLRSGQQYRHGEHLLNSLTSRRQEIPGPLEPREPAADFRAWLLATQPHGLTTAALGEPTWRIGHTHCAHAALTDIRTATHTITTGDPGAAEVLATWATTWRQAGRPGLADLQPRLTAFKDGWLLHASVRPTP